MVLDIVDPVLQVSVTFSQVHLQQILQKIFQIGTKVRWEAHLKILNAMSLRGQLFPGSFKVWLIIVVQASNSYFLLVKSKTKHEFHETCHSLTFLFNKKDSKQCCDTTMPESIHTKDESKCGSAFAFVFGVN